MKHRIGSAGVFALVLLAACEPMVSAEPRLEPEPVSARTGFLDTDAEIDAALRALHPGKPVDPRDRETLRALVAMMDRMTATPIQESSAPPVVPPSMERALRDFMEAGGDQARIEQILQRLVAERNAETR